MRSYKAHNFLIAQKEKDTNRFVASESYTIVLFIVLLSTECIINFPNTSSLCVF